ncbi:hypothetical protein [Metabacillus iocasae]|uniref:Uncharacterized protein n=1 Tax=Priestia iocasae TaxID=2291674 RepID=A0ABS2QWF6_9BACI|nr:hypothetical protein [Metabacillus iocasae]MBM7703533.1 hypothetical protein [Metabacillus iocasae]
MKVIQRLMSVLRKKRHPPLMMGATFQKQPIPIDYRSEEGLKDRPDEQYFRPSRLPILNTRLTSFQFFQPYYDKTYDEIVVPTSLLRSPEETIVHYFSVLREAENLTEAQSGGCGSVGNAKIPYPLAYNFFTNDYQQRISYSTYLDSFKGVGHTNLLKVHKLPNDPNHPSTIPYFIEIETIEGSNKEVTYFAYYYGYMYLKKEKNQYKIHELNLYGEDFLCAAYHLWQHNAEAVVAIEYGEWCKLIKKQLPTKQDGYIKQIDIVGTDGHDYQFIFFQLTNDTDILVSQYKRNKSGQWEVMKMDPRDCLEESKKKKSHNH